MSDCFILIGRSVEEIHRFLQTCLPGGKHGIYGRPAEEPELFALSEIFGIGITGVKIHRLIVYDGDRDDFNIIFLFDSQRLQLIDDFLCGYGPRIIVKSTINKTPGPRFWEKSVGTHNGKTGTHPSRCAVAQIKGFHLFRSAQPGLVEVRI